MEPPSRGTESETTLGTGRGAARNAAFVFLKNMSVVVQSPSRNQRARVAATPRVIDTRGQRGLRLRLLLDRSRRIRRNRGRGSHRDRWSVRRHVHRRRELVLQVVPKIAQGHLACTLLVSEDFSRTGT